MDIAPYPTFDGTQECAAEDPELFFPAEQMFAGDAIRVCRRCPFIRECLSYALTHGVSGVWGGTTEDQRKSVRRKNNIRPDNSGLSPFFQSVADVAREMYGGG